MKKRVQSMLARDREARSQVLRAPPEAPLAATKSGTGCISTRHLKLERSRWILAVKLRDRATTSAGRRGRTLSSSASGTKQTTHHRSLHGPYRLVRAAAIASPVAAVVARVMAVARIPTAIAACTAAIPAGNPVAPAPFTREKPNRQRHDQEASEDADRCEHVRPV